VADTGGVVGRDGAVRVKGDGKAAPFQGARIENKDFIRLLVSAAAVIRMLKMGTELTKDKYVYVISAETARSGDFESFVRALDLINSRHEGAAAQFRIVVVGESETSASIEGARKRCCRDGIETDTLQYRSALQSDDRILPRVDEESHVAGLATKGKSESKVVVRKIKSVCDGRVLSVDKERFTFGQALMDLALDIAVNSDFTAEAIERVKEMANEARASRSEGAGMGGCAFTGLDVDQGDETTEIIDDYLFGDLAADTQF
ncbi:MAG: hypothetical protein P9L88_06500, partial [Candidatus Tantalella remota]|nr:hypothetical protein [Candidatus Tantalella remota]